MWKIAEDAGNNPIRLKCQATCLPVQSQFMTILITSSGRRHFLALHQQQSCLATPHLAGPGASEATLSRPLTEAAGAPSSWPLLDCSAVPNKAPGVVPWFTAAAAAAALIACAALCRCCCCWAALVWGTQVAAPDGCAASCCLVGLKMVPKLTVCPLNSCLKSSSDRVSRSAPDALASDTCSQL